jgi:hypothetical protein
MSKEEKERIALEMRKDKELRNDMEELSGFKHLLDVMKITCNG